MNPFCSCPTRHALPILVGIILVATSISGRPDEPARDQEGFRYAQEGYRFEFPRDHGSHPEFKIEWWYLTGHLWNSDRSRRFGFQATFFRRGILPSSANRESSTTSLSKNESADFGSSQIYLAHMTVLDVKTRNFVYEERINRNGWDAGARSDRLDIFNGNWSLKMDQNESMRLVGSVRADALFDLKLEKMKEKVRFGNEGISRKGADPTAASHYITFTRLKTTGTLQLRGDRFDVHGQTWMDHEISSSQLTASQVGWDWASIQLDSGDEVMVYVMRRQDGRTDPYSTLAWIDPEGQVTQVGPEQFRWEKVGYWKSPHSNANYPIKSVLKFKHPMTGAPIMLRLRPLTSDQEIQGELGGIRYWEGACDVVDTSAQTIGTAYVELAGYDGKLQETLR